MKNTHNFGSVEATIKAEKLVSGTRDFELLRNPERAAELLGRNFDNAQNAAAVKSTGSSGRSTLIKYLDYILTAWRSSKVVVKTQTSDIFNQEFKRTIRHKSQS